MQFRAERDLTSEEKHSQTRDRYNEDAPVDLLDFTLPVSRWTSAHKDTRLLNHLLTLFWTWDNTVEPCLYRPLFEEDLADSAPQTSDPSKDAFCSSFLVNSLLALSCVGDCPLKFFDITLHYSCTPQIIDHQPNQKTSRL
jgi:hypothetical protein